MTTYMAHPMVPRVLLTAGAVDFADRYGAWWFVDMIAITTHTEAMLSAEPMAFWRIVKHGPANSMGPVARVICGDGDKGGGEVVLVDVGLDACDFPFTEAGADPRLWVQKSTSEQGNDTFVMMTPEEC